MFFNSNQKLFDAEWHLYVAKFKHIVGFKSLSLNLKHPKTQKSAAPHECIPEVYQEWQNIKSSWDRQSLLFSVIYDLVGEYMKPWQLANYLVADRNPVEAFEIVQEASSGSLGDDYPQHCAALAKSLIALTYYEESLKWAKKACEAEPKNSQFKIILADAYFLDGNHSEANKIYESRISLIPPSDSDSISDMFSVTFTFDTGVLPSPIFAIRLGKQLSDSKQSDEFWKLAETEFYYSHYFRLHHAYYLTSQGKKQECLAKLITLVQEMPWLEEASLSLNNLFECFNQAGNKFMPEFQEQLSRKIQDCGWIGEKMFVLNVSNK